jgi:hypothetical protein
MSQEIKHNQPDFKEFVKNLSLSQLNTLSEHISFEINKQLEVGAVVELSDGTNDTITKIHTEITAVTLKKSGKKDIKQIKKIKHTNIERINFNNLNFNNQENDDNN